MSSIRENNDRINIYLDMGQVKSEASTMFQKIQSKNSAGQIMAEISRKLAAAVEESRSADQINELTGEILEITDQTNLLAQNASIEAARAGEAGRGFAVVADEIRLLADNSRDTANKIQSVSSQVIGAVESLAQNAEDMLRFIDENVMKDYDSFVEVVEKYEQDADHVNGILTEFAGNSSDINDTIQAGFVYSFNFCLYVGNGGIYSSDSAVCHIPDPFLMCRIDLSCHNAHNDQ